MPANKIHIDRPLSNLAVKAFDGGMSGFIANQVMPIARVNKQSNLYYVLEKESFLRIHDTTRSKKSKANVIDFEVSSDSYYAKEYALATETALQDLANEDEAIDTRQNNNDIILTGLMRDYENRVASIITSISNVGSGVALTGTAKFSDYTNSDPIGYVNTGSAFIRQNTGLKPNTAIMDEDTFTMLQRHPDLLDMYKYTSGGQVTLDQMRSAFKVDRILIGTAIKENALENGTSSMTNIWGNNLVLAYINRPTGLKTVTYGLSLRWNVPGMPSMRVGRQRFSGPGTRNIEVQEAAYNQDEKIIGQQLAYALTGTL